MRQVFVGLVRVYQIVLSPILPFNHCRFYPSCSQYSIEAIEKHGVLRGLALASMRIIHCHPFSKRHGYDPVP